MSAVLEAKEVSIQFGGLKALTTFSLAVATGDLQGLIGPNGAGKTTAFNVLTGVYRPTSGEVRVVGHRVNGKLPHQINRLGLARTFQNIRLFKALSAIDNVRVACLSDTAPLFSAARLEKLRTGSGVEARVAQVLDAANNYLDWWRAILLTPGFQREEREITARAEELLEKMGLAHRRDEAAASLPYGEQRRLEIARALGTRPKVLLLDEPAAGMNTREKGDLMVLIRKLRDDLKLGILVIEHDMKLVMGICEKITVLDHGETIACGPPERVRTDPKVVEAYLGDAGGGVSPTQVLGTRAPVEAILEVKGLHVSYGPIRALHGIDLVVGKGEVVALIGANGAGKTSTLRAVSGMVKPAQGTIALEGAQVGGLKANQLVPKGLAHAPEGRGIFLNLTVEENLELGAYLRRDSAEISKDAEWCYGLFPVLKDRRKQLSGTLSGGEQQMLAISRALMSRPKLLLLDEPSLGLAPQVVQTIFRILREVNGKGVSILLVEQNAHLALSLAHYGYVLETGEVAMAGPGKTLLASPEVRRAYLGE